MSGGGDKRQRDAKRDHHETRESRDRPEPVHRRLPEEDGSDCGKCRRAATIGRRQTAQPGHQSFGPAAEEQRKQQQTGESQLGEQSEREAMSRFKVEIGAALGVVALAVAALANAGQRMLAKLTDRDPPEVVPLPADGSEARRPTVRGRADRGELVDLVAHERRRVPDCRAAGNDGGDSGDSEQRAPCGTRRALASPLLGEAPADELTEQTEHERHCEYTGHSPHQKACLTRTSIA